MATTDTDVGEKYRWVISIPRRMWHDMAVKIWVSIGSGNGLLPVGSKPLPEPILTYPSQEMIGNSIRDMCSESTLLKLLPFFPSLREGASQLVSP